MSDLEFDTAGEEEMDDFSVVPAATYNVQIVKSDLKDNKAKNGKRLTFQLKILDGKYKGRMLFEGLNYIHPDSQTQQISRKVLTSMVKACGLKKIQSNTAELHKIPLTVKVKIKPADGNYGEQNQITKYSVYEGVDGASKQTEVESYSKEEIEDDDDQPEWMK